MLTFHRAKSQTIKYKQHKDIKNTRQQEARQSQVSINVTSATFLKPSTETIDHMSIGQAFYSVTATTSKTGSPFVFSQERGTTSESRSEDLTNLLVI